MWHFLLGEEFKGVQTLYSKIQKVRSIPYKFVFLEKNRGEVIFFVKVVKGIFCNLSEKMLSRVD